MRRYGETRQHGRSYRHRPGVYAILPRDGRLLLTHQAAPVPEVQLPGGGIDPGEAVVSALAREVYEETGWRIAYPRRLGAYRRFTFMPEYRFWAEKVCQIYVATPVLRLGPPGEPGHTALWVPPETAIEALASEGDRAMLVRFMCGEFGPISP